MRVWATPQFWWRVGIVGCGVAGLLVGEHRIVYYTSQSNIITLGYFAGTLYWMVRRGSTAAPAPRLRGAVTLWILITCLISHFMLSGGENPLPGLADPDPATAMANLSLFLVHYVVPVLAVADWLVFGPHGVVPWRALPLWILYPLGYGLAIEARAAVFPEAPSRYPYFFLDPGERGYDWVAGQMVQLAVIFGALGALLLGADRLAAAVSRRRPAEGAAGTREVAAAEDGTAAAPVGTVRPGRSDADAAEADLIR